MVSKQKYKQTEVGEVPEDWKVCIFSEVINVNPKRTLEKGVKTKYVSMSDLKEFEKKIQGYIYKEYKGGSKFQNNDTLMARVTPCLENGKTAFVDILEENEIAFGSTEFIILSGKENLTSDSFVYYLVRTPWIRKKAIKSMTGTSGRQRVQTSVFDRLKISIPSLHEQHAIAKILSDLDAKIELNQQMNKTLETIGQAIFKHWFVDFEFPNKKGKPYKSSGGKMIYNEELDKEIPERWKVSKIGKELKTILGGTPSKSNKEYWENGTIPWINSGAINDFPIIQSSEKITEKGLKNSAADLMPKRTVVLPFVISLRKEIKISILGIESSGNQSVLGILENEKIGAEYIYYWIQFMKQDIYSWATGGAQQHINKGNVDKTNLLIPSENILMKFNELSNPIFEQIINNSLENANLAKLRDSLLPKLMSGKIRVKVPIEAKK